MERGRWRLKRGRGRMGAKRRKGVGCDPWEFDGERWPLRTIVPESKFSFEEDHQGLTAGYGQVGALLWTLMTRWETFK